MKTPQSMKFSGSFAFVAISSLCIQAIAQKCQFASSNVGTPTPLHMAVKNGDEAEVIKLIDKKANIDAIDGQGKTPLHRATENAIQIRSNDIAQLLINSGANVKAKDSNGITSLHIAARTGNKAIAQMLLNKGADVNALDACTKFTPLHWASEKCHFHVIQLLLDKGADVSRRNRYGKTPQQLVETHCKGYSPEYGINASELDITIIDDAENTFDKDFEKLLEERNNAMRQAGDKLVVDMAFSAIKAFVPFLDQALDIMSKLHEYYVSDNWTEILVGAVELAHRADIESDIKRIRAHLDAIKVDFTDLMKETLNGVSTEATALAGHIMRTIRSHLYEFALEDSDYRKYPMLAIGPLFLSATMISTMGPIYRKTFSDAACRMHHTLIEYRDLSVDYRLRKVNLFYEYAFSLIHADDLQRQHITSIEREPYRRDGYNGLNPNIIRCKNDSQEFDRVLLKLPKKLHVPVPVHEYVKDSMGIDIFFTSLSGESLNSDCTLSYFRYIRYRVESYFASQIESVGTVCPTKIQSNSKTATKSGYLTVAIDKAHWMSNDEGTNCNRPWGFCLLYVTVTFGESEPFKTEIKSSYGRKNYDKKVDAAIFYQDFKSGRISGNSPVTIEIWSKPTLFSIQFGDMLLHRWETNVIDLLRNGRKAKDDDNWIETHAEWKDAAIAING